MSVAEGGGTDGWPVGAADVVDAGVVVVVGATDVVAALVDEAAPGCCASSRFGEPLLHAPAVNDAVSRRASVRRIAAKLVPAAFDRCIARTYSPSPADWYPRMTRRGQSDCIDW